MTPTRSVALTSTRDWRSTFQHLQDQTKTPSPRVVRSCTSALGDARVQAINNLEPGLAVELTATPPTQGGAQATPSSYLNVVTAICCTGRRLREKPAAGSGERPQRRRLRPGTGEREAGRSSRTAAKLGGKLEIYSPENRVRKREAPLCWWWNETPPIPTKLSKNLSLTISRTAGARLGDHDPL